MSNSMPRGAEKCGTIKRRFGRKSTQSGRRFSAIGGDAAVAAPVQRVVGHWRNSVDAARKRKRLCKQPRWRVEWRSSEDYKPHACSTFVDGDMSSIGSAHPRLFV